MAKAVCRRGKWGVTYYDANGERQWEPVSERHGDPGSWKQAKRLEAEITLREAARRPGSTSMMILGREATDEQPAEGYIPLFLRQVKALLKASTYHTYASNLRLYVPNALRPVPLREIDTAQIKQLLLDMLTEEKPEGGQKYSYKTVDLFRCALSALFTAAKEDGHIDANPVRDLGLKRAKKVGSVGALETPAMTLLELDTLEDVARGYFTLRDYALIMVSARAGLRFSETRNLRWPDLHYDVSKIGIARNSWRDVVNTPKSGYARMVDMSEELADALKAHHLEQKRLALESGQPASELLFPEYSGKWGVGMWGKRFAIITRKAGLPKRFHPHSLRHTYAVHSIAAGNSLTYVQAQLGHSDLKTTAVYSKWVAQATDVKLANRLDRKARGCISVAFDAAGGNAETVIPFKQKASGDDRE
jgi:integrase